MGLDLVLVLVLHYPLLLSLPGFYLKPCAYLPILDKSVFLVF